MSNSNGIQIKYPNTIIAPHPRRNHSTPLNYNSPHHIKLNTLLHSKPIKRIQDPAPDEVLSEFLSLFNPSEPIQSIPIFINHHTNTPSSVQHTKNLSSPTTPVNTNLDTTIIQSPEISSPSPPPPRNLSPTSFSSPHSVLDHNHSSQQHSPHQNQSNQLGLTTIPNHLSTIVSSPISRCHNPLPRHAELDALACQLAEPFKSLHINPHSVHHDNLEAGAERDTKSSMLEEHFVLNGDDSELVSLSTDTPI